MTEELRKKAAEMLLNGATLLSEPCPYCKGVRVMKEGHACTRRKKNINRCNSRKNRNPPKKDITKKIRRIIKRIRTRNRSRKAAIHTQIYQYGIRNDRKNQVEIIKFLC
jgi:uncharacterized Zn finger protein (UPF0148 family)